MSMAMVLSMADNLSSTAFVWSGSAVAGGRLAESCPEPGSEHALKISAKTEHTTNEPNLFLLM